MEPLDEFDLGLQPLAPFSTGRESPNDARLSDKAKAQRPAKPLAPVKETLESGPAGTSQNGLLRGMLYFNS